MILSFRPVGKTFSTEETLLIDCPDLFLFLPVSGYKLIFLSLGQVEKKFPHEEPLLIGYTKVELELPFMKRYE
jgi:hypothetical protein